MLTKNELFELFNFTKIFSYMEFREQLFYITLPITGFLFAKRHLLCIIILIADLCVFLSTHKSYQYSNLQRYGNFTVVCKYRPELNFDNLNKFVNCCHQSISFAQWEIFMEVSSSSHNLGRELPYFCH